MITNPNQHVLQIAICTLVSWLGLFIHNMADLPGLTVLSPENSVPTLLTIVFFVAWWRLPNKRRTSRMFLAWILFAQFLVGGILSVLPFPFWPFNPPQTIFHYLMHLVYALAQLPLIVALLRQMMHDKLISGVSA